MTPKERYSRFVAKTGMGDGHTRAECDARYMVVALLLDEGLDLQKICAMMSRPYRQIYRCARMHEQLISVDKGYRKRFAETTAIWESLG